MLGHIYRALQIDPLGQIALPFATINVRQRGQVGDEIGPRLLNADRTLCES